MTRIYIAGSSRETERVRNAMDGARAAGLVVTHDWLAEIEQAGAANEGLTEHQRAYHARTDIDRGVLRAELFWLLLPTQPTTGAWVEYGYALATADALGMQLVTSGPGRERTIFTALAHEHHETDGEALTAIAEAACL